MSERAAVCWQWVFYDTSLMWYCDVVTCTDVWMVSLAQYCVQMDMRTMMVVKCRYPFVKVMQAELKACCPDDRSSDLWNANATMRACCPRDGCVVGSRMNNKLTFCALWHSWYNVIKRHALSMWLCGRCEPGWLCVHIEQCRDQVQRVKGWLVVWLLTISMYVWQACGGEILVGGGLQQGNDFWGIIRIFVPHHHSFFMWRSANLKLQTECVADCFV